MNRIKILQISFVHDNKNPEMSSNNHKIIVDILNNNQGADLLITPGFSIYSKEKDIAYILKYNQNENTLLNLEEWSQHLPENFFIRHNQILKQDIYQTFSNSEDFNESRSNMPDFLDELESVRMIDHKKWKVMLLICGENNILSNEQTRGNRAKFRFEKRDTWNNRFLNIFNTTDIFINPTHSQMGNQGKLEQRRIFFSMKKRIYCSCSNLEIENKSAKNNHKDSLTNKLQSNKSLQYCFYDGRSINGKILEQDNSFILKEYCIEQVN